MASHPELSVTAQGFLLLPREFLGDQALRTLYVTPSPRGGLLVFEKAQWNRVMHQATRKLSKMRRKKDRKCLSVVRILSSVAIQKIGPNGELALPKDLCISANISDKVLWLPGRSFVELQSPEFRGCSQ